MERNEVHAKKSKNDLELEELERSRETISEPCSSLLL
ncbi:hypothetical protein JL09_g6963 [Pichia kudriavzevii]|uniref:Uncharacterized protein n=1 Tax=Pichia kudriavzevii TaxID=4909 RepID=A0A099NIR5_PICKU|nr:hypothetical protein JL09_g6963 [Pichia kudriavzevii]